MGVIRKQSILGTAYTYIGAIIGFITTSLLFPYILSTEQIGLIGILIAYATIFSTVANLGTSSIIVKFFPYFKTKNKKHNGFLFIAIVIPLVGFVISCIVFYFIKTHIQETNTNDLLDKYIDYSFPMIFFILFYNIFEAYYRGLNNIVLGTLLKEVIQRLIILVIIFLLYFAIIDYNGFLVGYLLSYAAPVVIFIVHLSQNGQFYLKPKRSYVLKKLKRLMFNIGLFGIVNAFAGSVILNIDRIMVERYLGLSDTGIYTTAFFFGTIVILPSRSLIKIASAHVAQAWKDRNLPLISDIFRKSSINQSIIGTIVVIGLWINIENIFQILPATFASGRYVILFIALAFLTDMLVGVGASIISYSKQFRIQTFLLILLILLTIATNIIFIPIYGITGAALASFMSKFIVNTLRIVFIKREYKMWPFSIKHITLSGVALSLILINTLLPELPNFIADIVYRSISISILYALAVWKLNISDDVNYLIRDLQTKLFKKHQ